MCRSSCESQLRPGAEGILSTLDGRLLEGLVTSLFVVRGEIRTDMLLQVEIDS